MNTASILVETLGRTILHSLWQGALIFGLVRIFLASAPALSSRIRYHLSYLSLAALFTWFLNTFFHEWQRLQEITIRITEGASSAGTSRMLSLRPLSQETAFTGLFAGLERFFLPITAVYALGVLFLSIRYVYSLTRLQQFRTRGVSQPADEILMMLGKLKHTLGIERSIKILLTEKLNVPVVFGALKPVILLPLAVASRLTPDQLEAILMHELAHIRRNDYLLNIFQTIAETILFFNPFTWLISSIIRKEREHCCDDLVLAHTTDPLPYARALADLESYRKQAGSFALAASGNRHRLFHRIKRIMEMKKHSMNYGQVIIAVLLISLLTVSAFWFTPASAQKKEQEQQKKEQSAATQKTEKKTGTAGSGNRRQVVVSTRAPQAASEVSGVTEPVTPVAMAAAVNALKIAEQALKEVDVAGITREALASVNWEDIEAQVDQAMKEVDWSKIDAQTRKALKEAEKQLKDPKFKEELRSSMREARVATADAAKEMDEARKELAAARAEMAEAAKETAESAPSVEASARSGNRAAVARSNDYDAMLAQMESEGLIDREEGFEIKKEGSSLYINGKEQPAPVYDRYRKFIEGKKIAITGRHKDLTMSICN